MKDKAHRTVKRSTFQDLKNIKCSKWITETMINKRIIYFLIIFYISPLRSSQENSLLLKLVNHTQISSNQSIGKKYKPIEVNRADLKCKYKCITPSDPAPKFLGQTQARFIDQGTNDSSENTEMEAPVGKFSIFNLLPDDEEDDDHDNEEDDESVKNEEEETEEDDFNFFIPEDDIGLNKLEGTKEENLLKQYHRQTLRMHNLVFPLLLAYKLKFFMVIPLLLGSLVLLVGTTGVAGFFFALFAAALGIHVKTQEH